MNVVWETLISLTPRKSMIPLWSSLSVSRCIVIISSLYFFPTSDPYQHIKGLYRSKFEWPSLHRWQLFTTVLLKPWLILWKILLFFPEKCGKYCRFYRTLFIYDNSFRVFCSRNTQISFLEKPPGTWLLFNMINIDIYFILN